MKATLDWKLFLIVVITIFLSFVLIFTGKDIEFPLALLGIGSNIITGYVVYRYAKRKEVHRHQKESSFHVFIIFLFTLLAILSLFILTKSYFISKVASLLIILFLVYIMFLYSLYSHKVWYRV